MVFGLNATLRDLEQRHERVRSIYLAALVDLKDKQGNQRYSDQEHERLVREAEAVYDSPVDEIAAGYREQQINADSKAAKPGDVVLTFAGAELERANQLRAFVQEQYDGASVDQVKRRIEMALASEDTVLQALHLRYAEMWATLPARRTGEPEAVGPLLDQLQLVFTDTAKLQRAEEERNLMLEP